MGLSLKSKCTDSPVVEDWWACARCSADDVTGQTKKYTHLYLSFERRNKHLVTLLLSTRTQKHIRLCNNNNDDGDEDNDDDDDDDDDNNNDDGRDDDGFKIATC